MNLLTVNATELEKKVRQTEDLNPKSRLLIYTTDPETGDAGESCFSVPWSATNLSQMMKTFKAALPGAEDDDDEANNDIIDNDDDDDGTPRPVTRFTVPDCEAEPLMLIAMYLEYYSDKPEYVGVTGKATTKNNNNNNTDTVAAVPSAVPKKNGNDDDSDNDDSLSPLQKMRKATEALTGVAAAVGSSTKSIKSLGANHLERPYKPNQMEVDLKTVAASEPCLDGFEKYLAERINNMDRGVAVRTLRCLLCAGWYFSMNTSFLDLAGWLLSLRFRGNNVHQIKEMMKDENINVRKDHI